MLAEIFMLRMEANLRNAKALDTRSVPIDLTDLKPLQQFEDRAASVDAVALRPDPDAAPVSAGLSTPGPRNRPRNT
jgi:hypothetical protein